MKADLTQAYRTVGPDPFPAHLEIAFGDGAERQVLVYEKVTWTIGGERRGLRYGENPSQPAALYRPVGGQLVLGAVETLAPGDGLVSSAELLQSGKHPGKINLTDADSALAILRYFAGEPAAVIVKHNNPCGVAVAPDLLTAYERAYAADRIAAYGGCVALSQRVDAATAERLAGRYAEVVLAPDYDAAALATLKTRANLRILRIANMARLAAWQTTRVVDFRSLLDGGLVAQLSFVPSCRGPDDFQLAETVRDGQTFRVARAPDPRERADMRFGWLVECGVTSNSVIYVKDGVTVGIGTGEQDRVGVAEIARDKAYRKLADRLAFERHGRPYALLGDPALCAAVDAEVAACHGGLVGAVMVSDAFFPFRDGIDVGLREGVTAIVQPGGSVNDAEAIAACNDAGATMVFTGERCFRH